MVHIIPLYLQRSRPELRVAKSWTWRYFRRVGQFGMRNLDMDNWKKEMPDIVGK